MIMRAGALCLVLAGILAPSAQPTFRSRIELLRLDVTVVDKSGAPVTDLRASDFVVKVDGQPRPVSFARFYGPETAAPPSGAGPGVPSFADNTSGATQGRIVVLVADLESLTPGYEKVFLDTAGSLVDRLGPKDSVGLILVPGKGVEITRDHARVRSMLTAARGAANALNREHAIGIREAEGFFRNDQRVMNEVIERECSGGDRTCPRELDREARETLATADRQIRNMLTTLTNLHARLAHVDAPRTVVVLSAGLPYRQDSESYFRDLRKRAAASGATTYIVQLQQPETDASQRGKPGTASLSATDVAQGLSNVAGATDASVYFGVGRAAGAFDRIRTEIVHTYQLGVDSIAADADGKAHSIDVRTSRPDLVVRARREFMRSMDARPARTLADVMALPPGLAETPLAVGIYNTRGEEAATLKVVVALESLTGSRPDGAPSFAFELISATGTSVFQGNGKMKVQSDRAVATVAAQVAPGQYALRGAILDAAGRPGSVELPVTVGMRQAGDYQFSDLIVGTAADGFTPTSRIGPPSVTAILEVYTADPARFEGVTVDLELRKGSDVLASGVTKIAMTSFAQRRIAEGVLRIPEVAPGAYQVVAVVKRHGEPIAHLARALTHL